MPEFIYFFLPSIKGIFVVVFFVFLKMLFFILVFYF